MKNEGKIEIGVQSKEISPTTSKEAYEFRQLVKQAGFVELDAVTQAEIGWFLPQGFNGEQLTTALNLYSQGVRSEKLEQQIDQSEKLLANLSERERQSLYAIPYLVAAFEEYDPKRSSQLQTAYTPSITIQQVPSTAVSQDNRFVFERLEGYFSPVIKQVAGKGIGLAKKKVKDFAAKAIEKGGKKLIKKAFKKGAGLAIKAGAKAAIAGAAQAIGTTVPVLGNIVAFIVTEVIPRLIKGATKLFSAFLKAVTGEKDFRKQLRNLAAFVFVFALALGQPVLAGVAGFTAVSAQAAILGSQGISTGIAGAGQTFVYGLYAVAAPAIGIPILLALLVTPFVIAFIIFIINSGAFITPYAPALQITAFDNPYIKVEKTVTPDEVSNPPPNRTISYTVTVTAIQGSLTNISFSNSCEIFGESSGVSCPSATVPAPPLLISPINPHTFSYQRSIGSSIADSIVSDTFTVTADAEGALSQSNSSSASLVVGNPPLGCLLPSDNALAWPSSLRNNLVSAILRLTSQHAPFVAKVCAGPQVNLCYDPPSVSLWGWHLHRSDCDILFDSGGINNVNNAAFILAHEISHHLDTINGFWFQAYLDSGAPSEGAICSYGSTSNLHERFAEAIALYVQLPSYWSSRCSGTYQSLYPRHYNFVRSVIF